MGAERRRSLLRPLADRTRAGGEIELAPKQDGAWIISARSILMPVLEQQRVPSRGFGSGVTQLETRVRAIRVEGADVALVHRGIDTLGTRAPLRFAGVVLDSWTAALAVGPSCAIRSSRLLTRSSCLARNHRSPLHARIHA